MEIPIETLGPRWFVAIACLVIFFLALSRYWVSYDSTDEVPTGGETFNLARNIEEKGQFANPFGPLDTGPSALMPPVFPAFLALLTHEFGYKGAGIYAMELSAVIVLALQLALFPVFSKALGMGALNGFVAALIWIIGKVGVQRGHDTWQPLIVQFRTESIYAAILVAIAACCYCNYLNSSGSWSIRRAASLGALIGVALLTSTTTGGVFIGWLALSAWKNRSAIFTKSFLVIVALPVIIVLPWTVRNFVVFHRFVPLRDNLGLELSVSNNDCAVFGHERIVSSGCFAKHHPNVNIDEAKQVLAFGEVQYNDIKLREAFDWIKTHPARFLQLSAERFVVFWMPTETTSFLPQYRRLERLVIYGMTLLSLPGLWILYRKNRNGAAVCAVCLTLFPLIYYVVQYEDRYRYPILWVSFLLGALPITAITERVFGRARQSSPL